MMTILTILVTTSIQSNVNKETTKKVLRLHNDGDNFTLNSLSNEFPSTTVQSATDCFRLGKTINQFRRICLPSTQHLSSAEGSEPTYSSTDSLNTNEDDDALAEPHDEDDNPIIDDDEDNFICEIMTRATVTDCAKLKQLMMLSWEKSTLL